MKDYVHGGNIYRYPGILDYSANINPLGMPDSVKTAAIESIAVSDHYPDPHCTGLRDALAKREGICGEDLIFGNGAAELIFTYCQTIQARTALLLAPGFAEYEKALTLTGCEIHFFLLTAENRFFPGEELLEELKKNYDVIFLCNPNNPTGVCLPKEYLRRILERTKQTGTRVFLDECFVEFIDPGCSESMVSGYREYPHVFFLKAFTKMYAMAGLRLGYGITADQKLLEAMEERLQPWNVSVPAQAAGCAAAQEVSYPEKTRAKVEPERKKLIRFLRDHGAFVIEGSANYILFQVKESLDLEELLLTKGILIRNCANYRGLSKGWYRIAVRGEQENERLREAFAESLS